MNTADQVLKTLQESKEPLKSADIAALAGLGKKEVDKALKTLGADDKVHSPKRCFYAAR